MTLLFESKPCSRCGGSGHYSYCQSYGTRCFKCAGRCETLTKRGAVAQAAFSASLRAPASMIEPGAIVEIEGIPGVVASFWMRVERVERVVFADGSRVTLHGSRRAPGATWDDADRLHPESYSCSAESTLRVFHTREEKAPKIAAALALQASLTLKGEPRKRAASSS